MDNSTAPKANKAIDFHINHKVFSVSIGEDSDNKIQDGIRKFLNIDTNLNTQDIVLALIKKTHELVELEKSLEKLSLDLDNIKK